MKGPRIGISTTHITTLAADDTTALDGDTSPVLATVYDSGDIAYDADTGIYTIPDSAIYHISVFNMCGGGFGIPNGIWDGSIKSLLMHIYYTDEEIALGQQPENTAPLGTLFIPTGTDLDAVGNQIVLSASAPQYFPAGRGLRVEIASDNSDPLTDITQVIIIKIADNPDL